MDIGSLRHKVQLQRPSITQDSVGQPTNTWTTYYTSRAKIDILKGQLLYQTAEFINKNSYQITMRFPVGILISAADRVVFNDQVYVIQSVINVEQRNRELRLLCYVLNDIE